MTRMKTVAQRLADRRSPEFDKPVNFDQIARAARDAARAARAAGAPYETVRLSALEAGFREAGLKPRDVDPWAGRRDLNDAD